ncbi:MAG TPA: DinB family protein [Vicinamibacterales bacterium]|nr:DinB family protein [Vicinamibacterales bacterium]
MRGLTSQLRQLLFLIDSAYDHGSWHGPNLRGSIRGVRLEEAVWRPGPSRHNIWELVVHAAYWKYRVVRRLTGAPRGSFALVGSNWFRRPQEGTTRAWRSDVALLDRTHRELRDGVEALSARDLERAHGKVTNLALVTGIAGHDVYHAGQIQLLKRLRRDTRA